MHRVARRLVLGTLLCGLLAGIGGCGGGSEPPESSGTTTTLTQDAMAAQTVKEMSDYTEAVQAWFDDYLSLAESEGESALEFADPFAPTDNEVIRAKEFIEHMRTLVADLKEVSAPQEVAQAHSQLRAALSGELTALERYISALGWGSARDIELAYRQAQESYELMQRAVRGLSPYVDLEGVTQN